jgi:hypothetical protein
MYYRNKRNTHTVQTLFYLILGWRRTTHVIVTQHELSTINNTETNVIGQTVQQIFFCFNLRLIEILSTEECKHSCNA